MLNTIFVFSLALQFPQTIPINVKPYSSWAAFVLKDVHKTQKLVPKEYEITPVSLYSGMKPRHLLLFNSYYVGSTFFRGHRLEINVIAKHKKKNTPHFFVLECFSNTLHWDPINGIQWPNAFSIQTKMPMSKKRSEFQCAVNSKNGEKFLLKGNIGNDHKKVNRRFAVDSNHRCFYRDSTTCVDLSFDPSEISKDIILIQNSSASTNILSDLRGSFVTSFVHAHKMDFLASILM